ncbi:MAG: HAD family hydrolase [Sedimentisphaerales bacterium]|nr:HAD family hydrolase [Sedimentisphaerales bacterium]
MTQYKHIIWDWNGTLLDDVEDCVAVVNELQQGRGLELISLESYRELFDFPAIDFYRRMGFNFQKESFEELARDYMARYTGRLERFRLQQGARKVLEKLASAGLTHSVLSAYQQKPLDEAIDYFNLRNYFIGIIGLNDYYAYSKVEHGRQWLSQLHYQRHEILFIGDTLHDFEVAQAMGVDCLLLACGHQPRDRLQTCPAAILETISEVPQWLAIT